jgi:hypothetical protein
VIIPTTTLMYTLPISVMVAMVIMRASVIVIGRVVDGVQIAQGILQKRIYWEENAAVVFAVLAACIELFGPHADGFAFLRNRAAVVIFTSYIAAYLLRIYLMNYFKNTRPKGAPRWRPSSRPWTRRPRAGVGPPSPASPSAWWPSSPCSSSCSRAAPPPSPAS